MQWTDQASSKDESYAARVEQAMATLTAELPHLFYRDLTYDIYTAEIDFRDPVSHFKGKLNYRIIFWTLRFHARLFFTSIAFDLHNVSHPASDQILATWTVRGILRLPWQPQIYFNGTSTYRLNADALIYEHVDTWDRSPKAILQQFLPNKS